MAQEEKDELNTLAMMRESESFMLKSFLDENPEVLVGEINRILEWISVTEKWFLAISQVKASDGTILTRITIAPPPKMNLKVIEDLKTNSKEIILEIPK